MVFPNHIHGSNTGHHNSGAANGLESKHRSHATFVGSVDSLADTIKYSDLRDGVQAAVSLGVADSGLLSPLVSIAILPRTFCMPMMRSMSAGTAI